MLDGHSRCPRCGGRRTLDAAALLCPRCLLATALAIDDARDQSPLDPDHRIPYEIVTILARDAGAITYLAHPDGASQYVALKMIDRCDVPAVLSRFQQWKGALGRERHSSIARLIDVGQASSGSAYVATEYVTGSSLDALLRRGTLAEAERRDIARQLAEALEAAHAQGLAHMKLAASRVKIATRRGVAATLLGLGSSLVVEGMRSQPDLDVRMLADMCRHLGVELPPRAYGTMGALRAALSDGM